MAVRKKKTKKRTKRARYPRPPLMVVEISTDFLKLRPASRAKLCKLICCTEIEPRPIPMGGYCVIKRWLDEHQWCEQRICFDAAGRIIFKGPILCTGA